MIYIDQMTSNKEEIGARIALIRKENGDTQEKCADKLGIKRGTLAAYEKGTNAMPDDIRDRFVRLYDTTHDYIISGRRLQVVNEEAHDYNKKEDLSSLLDRLGEGYVANEIRAHFMRMLTESNEQKNKIIELLEQQNRLVKLLEEKLGIKI